MLAEGGSRKVSGVSLTVAAFIRVFLPKYHGHTFREEFVTMSAARI